MPVLVSHVPWMLPLLQSLLLVQCFWHLLNILPSQMECVAGQSLSVLQVHPFNLGLEAPEAALQTLPTVLLAQSALLLQMQKVNPVPARSEVSQKGPSERGLFLQCASMRHASQRFFLAGFLTQWYSVASMQVLSHLVEIPHAVELSQSPTPSQLYLPEGHLVQAPALQN